MSRKERIIEIELLRGLAFLAVALQHSIAHFAYVEGVSFGDGVIMTLLLVLAKFAVPVFIFITGMVLFYNYDGQFNYLSFLKKRAKDIIIPYILWSFVYFSLNYGWQQGWMGQSWKWFTMLFTGKTSSHLWYIVMILQFYLLFPVFRYVINKVRIKLSLWACIASIVGVGLLYVWLTGQVSAIGKMMSTVEIPVITAMFTKYADRNFLYFFFYFVLGACAGIRPDIWKAWIRRGRWMYISCFIILTVYYLILVTGSFRTPTGLQIGFHAVSLIRPMMVVFLLSSICVVYMLASWMKGKGERRYNTFILSIGKYSYGAYLVHALMLRVSYIFDMAWFVQWPIILRMMISFTICVLLSYLLMLLLSRFTWGKWLGGVPVKKDGIELYKLQDK
ncbi:acyltransferase [Paenibacillus sp. FA6]|uniref:acyltransferase n=1 Tax=Paenibacillus sp. FA6 TaxID=3413029 RepID=UPI003F65971C